MPFVAISYGPVAQSFQQVWGGRVRIGTQITEGRASLIQGFFFSELRESWVQVGIDQYNTTPRRVKKLVPR